MLETIKQPKMLWPTPTLSVEIKNSAELNRALTQIILEKEREIKAKLKTTPVAGLTEGLTTHWLEYNVLKWDYPAIREFRQVVLSNLREFFSLLGDPNDPGFKISGISCWANVLRPGESLEVHHHDPAFVSAHYQVQSGYNLESDSSASGKSDAGSTVYFRPGFLDRSHGGKAAGPTSPWDSDWRISTPPVAGKLFFFPSYVRHEVRPYMGPTERISIAMDVFVDKQESLIYFGGARWYVPE
jgi:Putative 2OG-Fe(II) oxygenase